MQSGSKWATSAAASVTLAAILSVWCAASDAGENLDQAHFSEIFDEATLIDCNNQTKLSVNHCNSATEFIFFMTSKLYWIHNGYVDAKGNFPHMGAYPALLQYLPESEKQIKSSRDFFFEKESPVFYKCLQGDCGLVIQTRSKWRITNTWQEISNLLDCTTVRKQKPVTFDGSKADKFLDAKRGEISECFPGSIPDHVLDIGIRISMPGNQF
jgi:hypothetical protein